MDDEQNNTAIDPVKSAREARRRRILENSNNRLGKITGRLHNEEVPNNIENQLEVNGSIQQYPDPELERDVFEADPLNLPMNGGNQDVFELIKTLQQEQKSSKNEELPKQQLTQTPLTKFLKSKYPIMLIALLVYSSFALNLDKMIIGSYVFGLLIVWEIFEFVLTAFIIKDPVPQNQLTVIISMFLGLNADSLNILFKTLGLFNKIIRDVAIFLFTFVFIHLAYSYLIIGDSMSKILDHDFNELLTKDEL